MRKIISGMTLFMALLIPLPSWAAVTFYWGMEDGAAATMNATTDFSAGDNTPTEHPTSGPSINGTAALVGSYGMQSTATAGGDAYKFNPASIISPTAGSVAFYINWQTFNASAGSDYFFARANLSSGTYIRIVGTATDELRLTVRDNTGPTTTNLDTTAVNIATGTTYFVTASWDSAAPYLELCVYTASGTLVEACATSTSAFTAPAALDGTNTLYVGDSQGGSAAFYWDNMFIGSAAADAATFYCNRNITSYANYAACPSGAGARLLGLMGVGR